MTKINLRKFYPNFYTTDCIIEVPGEVARTEGVAVNAVKNAISRGLKT